MDSFHIPSSKMMIFLLKVLLNLVRCIGKEGLRSVFDSCLQIFCHIVGRTTKFKIK